MNAACSQDMGFDQVSHRLQSLSTTPGLIGQSRQHDRHAFGGISLSLPIEQHMLAALLMQDPGQQVSASSTTSNHMKRGWCLGEAFTRPSGKTLTLVRHSPLARNDLQRLNDVLADLDEFVEAAVLTGAWGRFDRAVAR